MLCQVRGASVPPFCPRLVTFAFVGRLMRQWAKQLLASLQHIQTRWLMACVTEWRFGPPIERLRRMQNNNGELLAANRNIVRNMMTA